MSKTKAITKDIVRNYNTQRIIFRFLLTGIISLSIIYVYIIGSITFNVVARKSLESTARTLGSNISEMELTYLNNMNEVSKGYAATLGFVDAKSNIFATRSITHVAMR